jgi:hypothetical protein
MRRVVLLAAIAGFVIAVTSGSTWHYIYRHDLTNTGGARLLAAIVPYVWPTGIMMFEAERAEAGTLLAFVISAAANGGVYGTVAFLLFLLWERLARKESSQSR